MPSPTTATYSRAFYFNTQSPFPLQAFPAMLQLLTVLCLQLRLYALLHPSHAASHGSLPTLPRAHHTALLQALGFLLTARCRLDLSPSIRVTNVLIKNNSSHESLSCWFYEQLQLTFTDQDETYPGICVLPQCLSLSQGCP